jgi:N-methylhydantoinase A
VSDVVKDYSRTVLLRATGKLPSGRLRAEFESLQRRAEGELQEERWKGRVHYQRSVDVRYRGQGYELNVPFGGELLNAFRAEHRRRYGYSYDNRGLELVTLRLRATLKSPKIAWKNDVRKIGEKPERAPVFFSGKSVPALVYEREALSRGETYFGPAIVTEYSATSVIPPGGKFLIDTAGNLVVSL